MATERFIIPDGDLDTDITLIDTSTGIEYEDNFKSSHSYHSYQLSMRKQ